MTKRYLLAERTIDEKDLAVLIDWLGTNPWLTQGPLVREFERRWADWLGLGRAIFVNSGSSANLLTITALKEAYGTGEIIVPTLTWVSDIASVVQCGFTPVFVDINPRTLGMDRGRTDFRSPTC